MYNHTIISIFFFFFFQKYTDSYGISTIDALSKRNSNQVDNSILMSLNFSLDFMKIIYTKFGFIQLNICSILDIKGSII